MLPGRELRSRCLSLLRSRADDKTLIFCSTKRETEQLCRELRYEGLKAQAIHGDKSQRERDRLAHVCGLLRFQSHCLSKQQTAAALQLSRACLLDAALVLVGDSLKALASAVAVSVCCPSFLSRRLVLLAVAVSLDSVNMAAFQPALSLAVFMSASQCAAVVFRCLLLSPSQSLLLNHFFSLCICLSV